VVAARVARRRLRRRDGRVRITVSTRAKSMRS
jgi:hypothetical protein